MCCVSADITAKYNLQHTNSFLLTNMKTVAEEQSLDKSAVIHVIVLICDASLKLRRRKLVKVANLAANVMCYIVSILNSTC